ncbi:MAG: Prepilin peptidase/N-methyltransferase, partial [Dehalococcoidales bacterium]|nr:Prepilin peptidase/N-methyltransferase [Dehalococcoidales bacterium]
RPCAQGAMNTWTLVLGFILGACVGSFLNVCIDRLPRGKSLAFPPSHCDACGQRLRPFELIPVVSYLWLKGKCRYCGANVPRRVLMVELTTGLLFAWLSFSYGFSFASLVLAFYTCLFLILAIIDLEHGLILNKIVYPTIGLSLALAPFWSSLGLSRTLLVTDTMLHTFLSSLTGGAIFAGFLFLVVLFSRGGMGWADVKMAALVGLVTGFPSVLVAMMITFISGGLTAGFLLLLRRKGRKDTISYGPFLSLGAFVALIWGKDLILWYMGIMI